MPTLTNRKNGLPVHPLKGCKGNIILKTSSSYYGIYLDLRSDDKAILDTLLYVAGTNTNQFIANGDTLTQIVTKSGYAESTIRNALVRLSKEHLINPLTLPHEYMINPLLAIKGTECEVWKFIQTVEFNGEVPKEIATTCADINLTANY